MLWNLVSGSLEDVMDVKRFARHRIAIDDATPENGCMRFAPGTHNSIKVAKFGGDEGFF